ncbi:GNAT family N-acetyltransferase [Bacillus sp. FJAT-29937]|uniref:GNAT family N-acetyltransferase n=1 Tax=Bacillus sp. FJAT-29937 TaxID=1720553 RepID=UPI00082BCA23|nr:GNAT family N-acetyltransferase [Bacillus sp. FJAT-29937]
MFEDFEVEFTSTVIEGDVIKYIAYTFNVHLNEEIIGNGSFYVFSAERNSPADVREQCDALSSHMYQTMSAVKVFPDYWSLDDYKTNEEMGLDNSNYDDSFDDPIYQNGRSMGVSDLAQYEDKSFSDNTINVFGKLALLSEIKIKKEFRRKGYGKLAMEALEEYCSLHDTDFILLKPFPTETDDLKLENRDLDIEKTEKAIDQLLNFYEPLGYKRTMGRTDEVHLVKQLSEY